MFISVRPLLSLVSCPRSSCLPLKSPMIIVLLCLCIIPSIISFEGFYVGSRWLIFVLFLSLLLPVLSVFCVVFISSSISTFMLLLCIMHTPCPVLLSGWVIA